jgi:drug/metabolite transporter (DMT)-like permease
MPAARDACSIDATPPMRPHTPVPPAAIALITGAVLCFAILDAVIKVLTQRYPVPMLVWARYAVQALALAIWLLPQMGTALLRTKKVRLHLARAAILPLSSLLFFTSLRYLPLAEATAMNYSTPVLVMILAVIFLHERMTQPRIALAIAGFAGMFLIVRPGSAMFQGAALLSLGAALFYAVFQILTRKLASEDWRVLLFYPAIVGTVMMTAMLPWFGDAVDVPWFDVAVIIAAGLLGTLGHGLFILAFQRSPASALTPYTYVHLVWATLIGWLVFDRFPDVWTLAGMAVIAGSGLLIALHERRARNVTQEPTAVD